MVSIETKKIVVGMSVLDLKSIHTYIINLDARTDRWAGMQEQMRLLGKENVTRLSAINMNNLPIREVEAFGGGAWGGDLEFRYVSAALACLKSHVECIKDAKRNHYPYVLILEDDAVFEGYALRVVAKALTQLQDFDWELLFLGGKVKTRMGGSVTRVTKNLLRVNKLRLAHAYIVHHRAYDRIINEALSGRVPIDWYYSDFLQLEGKSYMVEPPVAFQKEEEMSDIEGEVVHKKKFKNKLKRLLRHIRSFL